MKQVHFVNSQTGREFTRTYYRLPIGTLREIATEKGLTFDYEPGAIVVYEHDREVAYCTDPEDLLHFLDTWDNPVLFDIDNPPAWALGQDPCCCDACGSLLVEDGDIILCPTCDERNQR